MWDEFSWRARLWRRKVNYASIGFVAAFLICLGGLIAAPYIFGPRGDLLQLVFEWLIELALGGAFAALSGVLFIAMKSKRRLRWLPFAAFLVFGGIALYAAWGVVSSAADLALPFKHREVEIARTYYEEPQTGRGAVPESGGWHIVTSDGDDYTLRGSGDGDHLKGGRYRITLSHFKNIVMSITAIQ